MIYFRQRTLTDCLLACIECLVQHPREKLIGAEWYGDEGNFLSYGCIPTLVRSVGYNIGFVHISTHKELYLENLPLVLGSRLTSDHITVLHAIFWDGEKLWEPYTGKFLEQTIYNTQIEYALIPDVGGPGKNNMCHFSQFAAWDKSVREFIKWRNENPEKLKEFIEQQKGVPPPCLKVI